MKYQNTKPIAILLATYNSERFLREQLESLFAQTCQDFLLYVRDDGSTDRTPEILADFTVCYPGRIVLMDNQQSSLGARDSFFWMLSHVESDYYMFCDHDDVWLPEKIRLTWDKMKKTEQRYGSGNILVNTDQIVVDKDLKIIAPSVWKYSRLRPELLCQFRYLSVCNFALGCTIMINHTARDSVFPVSPYAIMHDNWIALKVADAGIIASVPTPTMLYRQHEHNAAGIKKAGMLNLLGKLRDIKLLIRNNREQLNMVRAIRKTSLISYIYRKVIYFCKR